MSEFFKQRRFQHGQESNAPRPLRGSRRGSTQPITVGLDAYKNTYAAALFSSRDGRVASYTCPAGEAALAVQLASSGYQVEYVVYETGPVGFALARALKDAGFKVSVIAASRIPRGYAAAAKNDRVDAVKALIRRRKRIAEGRGKIKQKKTKGFLPTSGITEPQSI